MIKLLLLAYLTISISAVSLPTPPIFKSDVPREQYFTNTDDPIILECPAYAVALKIYWLKNGKLLSFTENASRLSIQHYALVISKPLLEDEGFYQCVAKNVWGMAISDFIHLKKAELNPFSSAVVPQEFVLKEGDSFSLPCQYPKGNPSPYIFWVIQKQDGTISSINDNRIITDPNGYFHFSNVILSDGEFDKIYTCSVFNPFLREYKLGNFFQLKVMPLEDNHPIRKTPLKQYVSPNITVLKGQDVKFYCVFAGVPLPSVTWYKKNGKLPLNRVSFLNFDKTLHITNVGEEDEGSYECVIKNGVGSPQSNEVHLKVDVAPHWITKPTNVNVTENTTHTFTCLAAGKPEPSVQWYINGTAIQEYKNPRWIIEGFNLTIMDIEASDTGTYQCNISNSHDYVFTNAYLNVLHGGESSSEEYQPVQSDSSQSSSPLGNHIHKRKRGHKRKIARREKHLVITQPPENQEKRGKESAVFKCQASTSDNSPITITWEKNDKPIILESDVRYFKTEFSLIITELKESDTGQYSCVVQSNSEKTSASANLIVLDIPNSPLNIEVDCSAKSALVAWQAVHDSIHTPLLNYIIQYNTTFDPETWVDDKFIPATETSSEVQLSAWANYTFRVVAWNRIGSSAPSEISKICSTPPEVPSRNPVGVKGFGTTPKNLIISWTVLPMIDHNAPGLYYVVNYKKANSSAEWDHVQIFDWKNDSVTISNTGTYEPYEIKVWAHNEKGRAKQEAETIIGYSGEDIPTMSPPNLRVIKVFGPKTADLSWSHVSKDSLRGKFKGYKIQTWVKGEPTRVTEVEYEPTKNSAVVDYLRPDSINEVRILAFNEKYDGPPSGILEIKTPQGNPGPVRSLTAFPLGRNDVYVTWEEPEETNGKLAGYKVFYREVEGLNLKDAQEKPGIISSRKKTAKITGLNPGTVYRVTVHAMTSAGYGDASSAEVKTEGPMSKVVEYALPLPGVPDFEITDMDKDFIQVRWIPVFKDQRPGNKFFSRYKKTGETQWKNTSLQTQDDYDLIKDLEPGTEYIIKVVSVEGRQESESVEKKVFTLNKIVPPPENNNNESYRQQPDDISDAAIEAWLIGVICAIVIAVVFLIAVTIVIIGRKRGRTHSGKSQANGKQTTQSHLEKADEEAKERLKPSEDGPDITKE